MNPISKSLSPVVLGVTVLLASGGAVAQSNVKPPKVQLWMDVSTGGMTGMPDMELPMGIGNVMGRVMGGGAGGASTTYGLARTPHVTPQRVLDLAFYSSLRPGVEVAQSIPPGMRMGDSLPLLPPKPQAAGGREREPGEPPENLEKPKGRILIYWGCGETVRPGQPRVIDLSRASPMEWGQAFAGRLIADRGARIGPSHVLYPNERTTLNVPRDSSLVGEHQVRGDGVPASMKFNLGEAQNLMPAIELRMTGNLQDSVLNQWAVIPYAQAYYLHAMSSQGGDMILWSSAETPDTGMGLFDYLPNATMERWVKDKVLLKSDVTQCAVPKGIFAAKSGREEAPPMLRMIAYGGESHFAYPPRPSDPKAVWEPEWAVRVRVKSHTMAMLGQEALPPQGAARPAARSGVESSSPDVPLPLPKLPEAVNVLKGLFGR